MATNPPRILIIKQTITAGFFLVDLARDLARRLPPVKLLSSLYPPKSAGKAEDFALPGLTTTLTRIHYSNRSLPARLITWTLFALRASWEIFTHSRRSLLLMVAQPPFLPLAAWLSAKLRGQRYILWIDDLYPDALYAQKITRPESLLSRLWSAMNSFTFRRASLIITLGPVMAEKVRAYLPADATACIPSPEVVVAPTWADPAALFPIPRRENPLARELGLTDELVVLFTGNLGLSHGLEHLAEAARLLPNSSRARFIIIGQGPGLAPLEAATANSRRFTFLPYQPRERYNLALNLGDLAVVSLSPGYEGVSMPSKTYSLLAAGCAILGISHAPSDISLLIEEHLCGVHVPFGKPEAIAHAIAETEHNRATLDAWKLNARIAAEGPFSPQFNCERLWNFIRSRLDDPGLPPWR